MFLFFPYLKSYLLVQKNFSHHSPLWWVASSTNFATPDCSLFILGPAQKGLRYAKKWFFAVKINLARFITFGTLRYSNVFSSWSFSPGRKWLNWLVVTDIFLETQIPNEVAIREYGKREWVKVTTDRVPSSLHSNSQTQEKHFVEDRDICIRHNGFF